jgi:cell division protein FtsB
MKFLTHIPSFLKNKFLIALVAFVVWMVFFDRNNLILQLSRHKEYKGQLQNKEYYQKEISAISKESSELSTNAASIEKFAREKYLMKKDNEDIFLIKDPAPKK